MYLELAENGTNYLTQNDELYLDQNGELVEGEEEVSPYIFVPGQQGEEGVYIREDYFDDLSDHDWERLMMYLEANQPGMSLFGLGKKGRARRAERRERKQERKVQRIEARSGGRALVAQAGGGLAGLGQGLSGILGSIFGGKGEEQAAREGQIVSDRPNYTPWIIGGAVVLGGGALIWAATRKKKKRY